MNVPIIASTFSGVTEQLASMGYDLIKPINWVRIPVRIDGVWRAEVRHG